MSSSCPGLPSLIFSAGTGWLSMAAIVIPAAAYFSLILATVSRYWLRGTLLSAPAVPAIECVTPICCASLIRCGCSILQMRHSLMESETVASAEVGVDHALCEEPTAAAPSARCIQSRRLILNMRLPDQDSRLAPARIRSNIPYHT